MWGVGGGRKQGEALCVVAQQKLTQQCKAIILQLKNKCEKRECYREKKSEWIFSIPNKNILALNVGSKVSSQEPHNSRITHIIPTFI